MLNQTYFSPPYHTARRRAQLTVVLLVVGAVISFLTIPSHILEMYFPPFDANQEVADNLGGFIALMLTAVLALATVGVYIATVISFLMWLHRASSNLRAFGEPQDTSPGWAVGSFFVPFANLFVPYRGVREVWKKSDPAAANSMFYPVSPPAFFPAWWGFWIASNIANNIYFRMSTFDAGRDATALVGIFSEILSIAAAGFAIMVIREIDRRQEERSRSLPQYGELRPPPPPVFPARATAPIAGAGAPSAPPLDQSNSPITGA